MATADFHHKHDVDQYSFPSSRGQTSITRFLTAGAIGTTLLGLSALTLTGTVMALILATPVLVLFSPVLVPAAIVVVLVAAGFVFSGGCGVAAIAALTWLYKYVSNYVSTRRRDYTYGGSYAQFGL
ncbi:putative oleosin [Rosa chinensis]|uniref:Oleosin n=1 Tax=Rosa chinensis TaxID=74649 RepID=A0A2P6Q065_ROSCH|nr:putative oleosin [Rosa chinensis]